MIRIVSTVLLAATVLAVAPAAAQDLPTATVSYADLNLASPAGQATLDRRIARAVEQVCPISTVRDLGMIEEHATCVATARKGAAQQVAAAIDNATRVAVKARDGTVEIARR